MGQHRGVDPDTNVWDSWRGIEETHWTVVLTFAAGGRQRQASWSYDPVLRSVEAADDEARWLSADEPAEMGPLPSVTPRVTSVYDVEAEGGVAASTRRAAARPRDDEPLDLMTAMRERTTVGRRSGRRRAAPRETARHPPTPALPLDEPAAASIEPEPEPVAQPTVVEEPEVVLEPAGSETLPPEPDEPEERDEPDPTDQTDQTDQTAQRIPAVGSARPALLCSP